MVINNDNINEILDALFKSMDKPEETGIDPVKLPNSSLPLLKDHLWLSNGEMFGLSTVEREGSATMHNRTDGVYLITKLFFKQIRINYDWSSNITLSMPVFDVFYPFRIIDEVVFFHEQRQGMVAVTATNVLIFCEVRIFQRGKGLRPKLLDFRIVSVGSEDVDIGGLGSPVDAFLSDAVSGLTALFSDLLYKLIAGPIKQQINLRLDEL